MCTNNLYVPDPPFKRFTLPKADKSKDPIGPPPQPPLDIDHLMSLADSMASKKQAPAKATPQQSSEPKGKKRKAALISKGLGDVVPEWIGNGTNPTPWCTVDHTKTANVGLRYVLIITNLNYDLTQILSKQTAQGNRRLL
jgi:hypothetical protein